MSFKIYFIVVNLLRYNKTQFHKFVDHFWVIRSIVVVVDVSRLNSRELFFSLSFELRTSLFAFFDGTFRESLSRSSDVRRKYQWEYWKNRTCRHRQFQQFSLRFVRYQHFLIIDLCLLSLSIIIVCMRTHVRTFHIKINFSLFHVFLAWLSSTWKVIGGHCTFEIYEKTKIKFKFINVIDSLRVENTFENS